jgi:hypothetical protein
MPHAKASTQLGNLAGNIYVNTNDSRGFEVNLSTDALTLIATGGARGNFAPVDASSRCQQGP